MPAGGPLDVAPTGRDGLTVIRTGAVEVTVPRLVGCEPVPDADATLLGAWGQGSTGWLAAVRVGAPS